MFDINHFWLFALATLLLNITPGNDFIYVASRSLGGRIRAGIISAFGVTLGLFVHVTASVLGLSVLLAQSAVVFNLVKYIGAAYLVYLGIKMLITKAKTFYGMNAGRGQKISAAALLKQGFLTNVFNPKVALFFISFLPQFADAGSPYFTGQLFILGLWFIFSGTLVSIAIALFFGKLRNMLSSLPLFWKLQQKFTALVLILLGLKIAMEKR
jgi:threonine/homoserine/homoserine lactone efflux protein